MPYYLRVRVGKLHRIHWFNSNPVFYSSAHDWRRVMVMRSPKTLVSEIKNTNNIKVTKVKRTFLIGITKLTQLAHKLCTIRSASQRCKGIKYDHRNALVINLPQTKTLRLSQHTHARTRTRTHTRTRTNECTHKHKKGHQQWQNMRCSNANIFARNTY